VSTGEAARSCGRGFLMCDMDARMVKIARKRLGLEVESDTETGKVPDYVFEYPSVEEWNLHPEDLKSLYDEMVRVVKSNLESTK